MLAVAVAAVTAVTWIMGGPELEPSAPPTWAQGAAGHYVDFDVDGDGKNERIWIQPSDPDLGCLGRLIVRDDGVDYAAAEQVAGMPGGTFRPEVHRIKAGVRAVAVWSSGGGPSESLHMFLYRRGRIDPMGAFFGDRGVRLVDVDGDGRLEVVVHRTPPPTQPKAAVEVYALRGRAFVYSRGLTARLQKR